MNIPIEDLHTAEGDALANAILFSKILKKRGVKTLKNYSKPKTLGFIDPSPPRPTFAQSSDEFCETPYQLWYDQPNPKKLIR